MAIDDSENAVFRST